MVSLDRPGLVVVFLHDFEDITVRIAEEEPCERRLAQGLDQHRPLRLQPLFQPGELDTRKHDGDVPAELTLESRGFELGILDQMQLQPRLDRRARRPPC